MEEDFATMCGRAAEGLHWLGRYNEANTFTMLARYARAAGITTVEEWETHVMDAETAAYVPQAEPASPDVGKCR